ncbi:HAD family hydrolase [Streptomyces sp. PTD5-9]|uniref:HAD family hydrolase n=1 Tax=Streptomyces sp. PTD5-9 TaxID=3120150 RepID=UPI00300B6624
MTSPIPAVPAASAVPPASAAPPFPATPPASAVSPVSPAAPGTQALRDAEDAPVATGASVTLVASDLDRTLIYSSAALGLRMPDAEAPRLLCVEVYQHKPLSHLTETAASLLDELARTTVFVPTTTRTREQYGRIRLPGPAPRFAICANGGHLLVDGESDPDWRTRVSRRLATESASLAEVRARLLASADPAWLLKERVAEDLFAYLVVERSALPDGWVEELGEWAGARGWTVSLQGRKVYAVPAPLTKSAAMREVARRTGATLTLAAGDSLLDADLLLAADHAWRPAHGELAESGWSAPHVRATAEDGVAAGEEILRQLLRASRPDTPGRHHP